MTKKTGKTNFTEVRNRPRGIDSYLPGVDSSKVIDAYPVYLTEGPQVKLLWDNEVTQFIKHCFLKLFRRR